MFYNNVLIFTNAMKIRSFKKGDTKQCANLIKKTYQKYNQNEHFDGLAAKKYLDFFDLRKQNSDILYQKFQETKIFLVAVENEEILGLIRGKENKISNLFVDGRFHKRGIGQRLVTKFEQKARRLGSKKIKIKSSVHALLFYQKMGYKKTTGLRNYLGLKTYSMKKLL
jgi:histone acetyltransferase (RNA polymerase elongator complex component)